MNIRIKKHRIIKDAYGDYECQIWRLWFPIWVKLGCSTFYTIEKARNFIEEYNKTLWED